VFATTATDEIGGFLVTDRGPRVALRRAATAAESATAIETLFRTVGTFHGSTAPTPEAPIGGDACSALLFTIGRVSCRLLARSGRFETLFQLGTVALELSLQLVTVTTDGVADGTFARTRVGVTARGDLAAFLHVIRISPTQLAQRLCRISHQGGAARGRG
jgi:hypothetical protein